MVNAIDRSEQRTEQILKQAKNKYYLKREHIINFKKVEYILPEKDNDKPYTLVLDLDETLVHFVAKEKKFKLRPGCIQFLKDMSQLFEIVIFTAAAQDYADFILNYIDKETTKYISHRLYRTNC
jgi:CTD small phosphatase-like protein 2